MRSSVSCEVPGALAALTVFPEAHAALAGAGAGALALEVLQREARRADHREQAGTPSMAMPAQGLDPAPGA